MLLGCERCGRPIPTGRYCSECASFLEKEFMKGLKIPGLQRHREKERMYTAHRRKKKIKGINNSGGNDDIIHEDLKVGDEL